MTFGQILMSGFREDVLVKMLTRFIDDNKVQTQASLNSPPVISTLFARELKSQTKNKRAQSYVAHLRKRSRVKSKPLYYYNQILVEDL